VLGGRFYVIVLDDIGTSPTRSPFVIRAARQFVERHFAANDTAAVVYTSALRDRAQEFTSDRALLLAAIDKFQGTKLRSSTMDKLDGYYMELRLAEGLQSDSGEPLDPTSDAARRQSPFSRGEGYPNRTYDMNDIERGQRALGVLRQLKNYADFLANVRGRRKAMVLFSEGIDYPVHDIFAAHDATTVLRAMEDAITAAARSNVNIFTVDPRGLVGLTSEYIELSRSNADLFQVAARDPRYGMQPHTALLAEMRQTQESLRSLAEQTGGLAAIDTNSFASSFDRIVQANSLYYMLGYYPPSHPRDGRFHKIEVRARRPGLRLTARKGYASARGRAPAEREKIERERLARLNQKGAPDHTSWELREALNSPLQRGGMTLSVQAAPFRKLERAASVALAIEIDGSRIQFAPQNDKGVFSNTVELSLFSISQQGKPMQGVRTELELNLRPDSFERVKTHGLRVNSRVDLPPGRYQMRVGVRESGAGDMGTVFYDLDVPDFGREPLMMSGLLLTAPSAQRVMTVQSDETIGKVLPGAATSRRTFVTSDVLGLHAEIYAAVGQVTQRIDVTTRLIAASGQDVSVGRDELTGGLAAGREKSATYSLSRTIPLRDVAPGSYLLRVEAQRRGDADRMAVRETPITIVAE
jgi:VWFA-related protein